MKKALLIVGALFTGASAYAQEAAADSLFNMLDEITVTSNVIDIAKERETPIAVSTISPAEISLKVGNLEFVEVMNNTPGVYATKQGGGYGDSRLSLRGFDQRNTSFLINGQPVNDMENGWVYWSNWQGLSDVASGIQIQRGLGASRLAVPSVGGTVSIFTKAAELKEGVRSLSPQVTTDILKLQHLTIQVRMKQVGLLQFLFRVGWVTVTSTKRRVRGTTTLLPLVITQKDLRTA